MNRENEAPEIVDEVARDRRVAEQFSRSAEAHYNLGNSLLQHGDATGAIASYRRAVELRPGFGGAHSNLGVALQQGQRFSEARECFLRAIELEPNDALAHNNLGSAELALGNGDEAQRCFRRAIELKPDFADAVFNLGHALQLAGRLDEAAECFEQAVKLQPGHMAALNNLGNLLRDSYRLEEAILCLEKAIAANPNIAEVHNNLGVAYRDNKQGDEAITAFRRALALRPEYAEAENNLGNVYKDLGMLDESLACLKRAVALAPHEPMYYDNLGLCSMDLGRPDEAAKYFEQSERLDPNSVHLRLSRSLLMLLLGDYERGWAEHECRWQSVDWRMFCQAYPRHDLVEPVWDGTSPEGKTILLQAEQGLGDTIQFVRYSRLVQRSGGRVVLECPPPLTALLASAGADEVVAAGEKLPPFDTRISLMSLPAVYRTTLHSVPSEVPYLFAAAGLIELWREKLAGCQGTRVGINWRGRPGRGVFRLRDIPLERFEALSRAPGVRLISLQGGAGREDLVGAGSGDPRTTAEPRTTAIVDLGSEVDTVHGAFMDTAAIMKNLDLVITSDTAIAHLAGALGVPVWIVLPFAADWRWLLARSDSPWYPTMRLFRQQRAGDWASVFEGIEGALQHFAKCPGKDNSGEERE